MTTVIAPFPQPLVSKDIINQIINQVGRDVFFYYPTSLSGCSVCSLDPISNTSTDSFCVTCSGRYWIPTYSGAKFTAKVTWGMSENNNWQTGGIIDDGSCTVQILHSGYIEDVIFSSEYAIVDDRQLFVKNIILRGVPEVNRILVVLKEKERI